MPTFPHQKAKKSPFQQHAVSYNPGILLGSNAYLVIVRRCVARMKRKAQGDTRLKYHTVPVNQKSPKRMLRGLLVAPTGVDPVTFRFSVERSTN